MGRSGVRKVLFITGSRGEYGYIRPLLKRMRRDKDFKPYIVATNMHLLPEFGASVREFEADGLTPDETPLMALAGYTRESVAKSLGVLQLSLVDTMAREKPDFVLLAGDRGEQLAAAVAAAYLNLPVAHIQAGELSGNIDGMARHAITKLAHLHFAANEDAARRLRRMGEEKFRIHRVGAPQLDDLKPSLSNQDVRKRYRANGDLPLLLVLQHPVTEHAESSGEQMRKTLEAVLELDSHAVVIYPNNDAGSIPLQRAIEAVRGPRVHVERNVPRDLFASLLAASDVLVGNSSAGILEAPSFALPAVNLGSRQSGRLQGKNVINAGHEKNEIIKALRKALSKKFRASLEGRLNPYGDGKSSERILKVLKETPIDERLLVKRLTY